MAIPPELMASASEVTKLSKLSVYRGGRPERVARRPRSRPSSQILWRGTLVRHQSGHRELGRSPLPRSLKAHRQGRHRHRGRRRLGPSRRLRRCVAGGGENLPRSLPRWFPSIAETPAAMRFGSAMRRRRGHGVGFRGAVQASGVR
jgi:hypothetical protein